MKEILSYLVSQGYDLDELILMKIKTIKRLYRKEVKLELQLLDPETLTVNQILDRDATQLLAA